MACVWLCVQCCNAESRAIHRVAGNGDVLPDLDRVSDRLHTEFVLYDAATLQHATLHSGIKRELRADLWQRLAVLALVQYGNEYLLLNAVRHLTILAGW